MSKISNSRSQFLRIGFVLVSCWGLMVALPSIKEVRAWILLPLYVHDEEAAGDLAYVMADGSAYWERLRAASDLYHMHRVPMIYILDQPTPAKYNFVSKRLEFPRMQFGRWRHKTMLSWGHSAKQMQCSDYYRKTSAKLSS